MARTDAVEAARELGAPSSPRHERSTAHDEQLLRFAEDFAEAYGRATALATQLRDAYRETVQTLARAVETRDAYTGAHITRVCRYSRRIGERLGLKPRELWWLEVGATLHDIGKIGVPDAVLTKAGALTDDEWALMRRHPEVGRRMLASVAFLEPALDVVAHHHERWDGRGYPAGIAAEAIPLSGRIVALADAFDAMTTNRPYRPRKTLQEALREIVRERGAQFDPSVVRTFLATLPSRLVEAALPPGMAALIAAEAPPAVAPPAPAARRLDRDRLAEACRAALGGLRPAEPARSRAAADRAASRSA
jgi:HD-GYP domain-containing protein (c-di-GMP phosphodiesterase class II)